MTTRENEIQERLIDLLIDKGISLKENMNDVRSFTALLYQSERQGALGKDATGSMKTDAYLFALEYLNLTEEEINNI